MVAKKNTKNFDQLLLMFLREKDLFVVIIMLMRRFSKPRKLIFCEI